MTPSLNVSASIKFPIPAATPKPAPVPAPGTAAATAANSSMEYLVCVNDETLAVRDETLETVLFRADRNESLLPMQSWTGADVKKKTIGGKEYTFVKVQFPERDEGENVGWLAQEYVRLEGQCPAPVAPVIPENPLKGAIKSIDSENCCTFPTIERPTHNYMTGMRRFKAGRGGGRLHAATDLYRKHGERTRSLADGKVVNGLYEFYQGTYAMEVQYPGGFIARYGELTGKKAEKTGTGKSVTRGQNMGYIGTVNSGCCLPMLHFELYKGTKTGPLSVLVSVKKNIFQRRTDLMNPTDYVRRWEKLTFGVSR